jgi:hypothetical protein
MKKISVRVFMSIMFFIMIMGSMSVFASGSSASGSGSTEIKISVNGQIIQFDQPIQIEQNIILAPISPIADRVGAEVRWDAVAGTTTIIYGNMGVAVAVNTPAITVRNMITGAEEIVPLPVEPRINRGVAFMPIEDIFRALGLNVQRDETNRMLQITTPDYVPPSSVVAPPSATVPPASTATPPRPVITITNQPSNRNVTAGSINSTLAVMATVTQGGSLSNATLSYQWYVNTTNNNTGGTAIGGATRDSFTIPTTLTAGTYYYYCLVSASGGATSVRSSVARVIVAAGATIPVISINTHPTATTNVVAGSISGTLTVTANVTQGATLSYQWYRNTTNNNTGGDAVNGATRASFTIPTTLAAGTYYYYCVVSASDAASVRSSVATVSVSSPPTGFLESIKKLRNENRLSSSFDLEAGFLRLNKPDGSKMRPYIYSSLQYNMGFYGFSAFARVKYEIQPRNDLTDSKGNNSIGWSWFGFDAGVDINLFNPLLFSFAHQINVQLTPDYYNWGNTNGNGYNGSFSFSFEYDFMGTSYLYLYLPVTYAQAYTENYYTQVQLQARLGIGNILSTGLGMWLRTEFGLTDGSKRGKNNDSIYRGITFRAFYWFSSMFGIPLYTHIQIGIPNIEKYGIDFTFHAQYTIGRITPWIALSFNYLGNGLNRDSVVNLRLGATYRW